MACKGDFNVILNEKERFSGVEFTQQKTMDFAQCMSGCVLTEVSFSGSKYRWWNGRVDEECIFKRLDRIFINQEFADIFSVVEVEHLHRQGSDHAPLNLTCNSEVTHITKSFKFLNFWCSHKGLMEVVEKCWQDDFMGSPFLMLHAKLKKVKSALVIWSKQEFGNIFNQIATLEDIVKVKEAQFEIISTSENRAELHRVQAELLKFRKFEEEFWRQKAGMKWFTQGDKNTKFFHSYIRGKRKKLQIRDIEDAQGHMLKRDKEIGQEAVRVFRISSLKQMSVQIFPCWMLSLHW